MTESKTKRNPKVFLRSFTEALRQAVAISTVAAAVGLVEVFSTAAHIVDGYARPIAYVGVVALTTFVTIWSFVLILRDRTKQISRLQAEVSDAFRKALDHSSLNPRRLEEIHDGSNSRTTG